MNNQLETDRRIEEKWSQESCGSGLFIYPKTIFGQPFPEGVLRRSQQRSQSQSWFNPRGVLGLPTNVSQQRTTSEEITIDSNFRLTVQRKEQISSTQETSLSGSLSDSSRKESIEGQNTASSDISNRWNSIKERNCLWVYPKKLFEQPFPQSQQTTRSNQMTGIDASKTETTRRQTQLPPQRASQYTRWDQYNDSAYDTQSERGIDDTFQSNQNRQQSSYSRVSTYPRWNPFRDDLPQSQTQQLRGTEASTYPRWGQFNDSAYDTQSGRGIDNTFQSNQNRQQSSHSRGSTYPRWNPFRDDLPQSQVSGNYRRGPFEMDFPLEGDESSLTQQQSRRKHVSNIPKWDPFEDSAYGTQYNSSLNQTFQSHQFTQQSNDPGLSQYPRWDTFRDDLPQSRALTNFRRDPFEMDLPLVGDELRSGQQTYGNRLTQQQSGHQRVHVLKYPRWDPFSNIQYRRGAKQTMILTNRKRPQQKSRQRGGTEISAYPRWDPFRDYLPSTSTRSRLNAFSRSSSSEFNNRWNTEKGREGLWIYPKRFFAQKFPQSQQISNQMTGFDASKTETTRRQTQLPAQRASQYTRWDQFNDSAYDTQFGRGIDDTSQSNQTRQQSSHSRGSTYPRWNPFMADLPQSQASGNYRRGPFEMDLPLVGDESSSGSQNFDNGLTQQQSRRKHISNIPKWDPFEDSGYGTHSNRSMNQTFKSHQFTQQSNYPGVSQYPRWNPFRDDLLQSQASTNLPLVGDESSSGQQTSGHRLKQQRSGHQRVHVLKYPRWDPFSNTQYRRGANQTMILTNRKRSQQKSRQRGGTEISAYPRWDPFRDYLPSTTTRSRSNAFSDSSSSEFNNRWNTEKGREGLWIYPKRFFAQKFPQSQQISNQMTGFDASKTETTGRQTIRLPTQRASQYTRWDQFNDSAYDTQSGRGIDDTSQSNQTRQQRSYSRGSTYPRWNPFRDDLPQSQTQQLRGIEASTYPRWDQFYDSQYDTQSGRGMDDTSQSNQTHQQSSHSRVSTYPRWDPFRDDLPQSQVSGNYRRGPFEIDLPLVVDESSSGSQIFDNRLRQQQSGHQRTHISNIPKWDPFDDSGYGTHSNRSMNQTSQSRQFRQQSSYPGLSEYPRWDPFRDDLPESQASTSSRRGLFGNRLTQKQSGHQRAHVLKYPRWDPFSNTQNRSGSNQSMVLTNRKQPQQRYMQRRSTEISLNPRWNPFKDHKHLSNFGSRIGANQMPESSHRRQSQQRRDMGVTNYSRLDPFMNDLPQSQPQQRHHTETSTYPRWDPFRDDISQRQVSTQSRRWDQYNDSAYDTQSGRGIDDTSQSNQTHQQSSHSRVSTYPRWDPFRDDLPQSQASENYRRGPFEIDLPLVGDKSSSGQQVSGHRFTQQQSGHQRTHVSNIPKLDQFDDSAYGTQSNRTMNQTFQNHQFSQQSSDRGVSQYPRWDPFMGDISRSRTQSRTGAKHMKKLSHKNRLQQRSDGGVFKSFSHYLPQNQPQRHHTETSTYPRWDPFRDDISQSQASTHSRRGPFEMDLPLVSDESSSGQQTSGHRLMRQKSVHHQADVLKYPRWDPFSNTQYRSGADQTMVLTNRKQPQERRGAGVSTYPRWDPFEDSAYGTQSNSGMNQTFQSRQFSQQNNDPGVSQYSRWDPFSNDLPQSQALKNFRIDPFETDLPLVDDESSSGQQISSHRLTQQQSGDQRAHVSNIPRWDPFEDSAYGTQSNRNINQTSQSRKFRQQSSYPGVSQYPRWDPFSNNSSESHTSTHSRRGPFEMDLPLVGDESSSDQQISGHRLTQQKSGHQRALVSNIPRWDPFEDSEYGTQSNSGVHKTFKSGQFSQKSSDPVVSQYPRWDPFMDDKSSSSTHSKTGAKQTEKLSHKNRLQQQSDDGSSTYPQWDLFSHDLPQSKPQQCHDTETSAYPRWDPFEDSEYGTNSNSGVNQTSQSRKFRQQSSYPGVSQYPRWDPFSNNLSESHISTHSRRGPFEMDLPLTGDESSSDQQISGHRLTQQQSAQQRAHVSNIPKWDPFEDSAYSTQSNSGMNQTFQSRHLSQQSSDPGISQYPRWDPFRDDLPQSQTSTNFRRDSFEMDSPLVDDKSSSGQQISSHRLTQQQSGHQRALSNTVSNIPRWDPFEDSANGTQSNRNIKQTSQSRQFSQQSSEPGVSQYPRWDPFSNDLSQSQTSTHLRSGSFEMDLPLVDDGSSSGSQQVSGQMISTNSAALESQELTGSSNQLTREETEGSAKGAKQEVIHLELDITLTDK